MVADIKINESDFELIKTNMKTFLHRSGGPFENFNFNKGALAGFMEAAPYLIHFLAYQLNTTVSELFLNTVTLEENIYAIIENFNYIPRLKTPAKRYLNVEFDANAISYVPATDTIVRLYLNSWKYNSTYMAVPTLRDKWQQNLYTDASASAWEDSNLFYYYMTYNEVSKKLEATMPCYQAEWKSIEIDIDGTFTQEVELEDSGTYYLDKVVFDSLRVFVENAGATQWHEYKNLRKAVFDENLYAYMVNYTVEKGLTIKFDISHFSRELLDGEKLRIFFAVTEGNDINESSGNQTFDNEQFESISITQELVDGVTSSVFESLTYGASVSVLSNTVSSPYAGLSTSLIDGNNALAYFDNGTDKQTTDSIKQVAALWFTAQGRAVTENDYNFILQNKFVEYKGIKSWSGKREFLDIEELITTQVETLTALPIGTTIITPSGTEVLAEVKYLGNVNDMKEVQQGINTAKYKDGVRTIDQVTSSDLAEGKFVRDVGFVYYTFYDDQFQFVNTSENKTEIVQFIDEYKIHTIYTKYMNPNFTLVKPRITLTLNKAYIKSFSILTFKYGVMDYFNNLIAADRIIDVKEIDSYLRSLPEIDIVDDIEYTVKFKINNVDDPQNEWMFVRPYSRIKSDFDTTIGGTHTFKTLNDKVYIDDVEVGDINKQLGQLRFKNWNTTSGVPFITDSTFYIENCEMRGYKLNDVRENVVGIESIQDIDIFVE